MVSSVSDRGTVKSLVDHRSGRGNSNRVSSESSVILGVDLVLLVEEDVVELGRLSSDNGLSSGLERDGSDGSVDRSKVGLLSFSGSGGNRSHRSNWSGLSGRSNGCNGCDRSRLLNRGNRSHGSRGGLSDRCGSNGCRSGRSGSRSLSGGSIDGDGLRSGLVEGIEVLVALDSGSSFHLVLGVVDSLHGLHLVGRSLGESFSDLGNSIVKSDDIRKSINSTLLDVIGELSVRDVDEEKGDFLSQVVVQSLVGILGVVVHNTSNTVVMCSQEGVDVLNRGSDELVALSSSNCEEKGCECQKLHI